jgi:uncharacterized membrane protein
MNLAPLTSASLPIQLHAFAAMAAFGLGVVQLAAPKGTIPHRTLGYTWVGLMLVVAISSFWIHDIRQFGAYSLIHVLSLYTLAMLPLGLYFARGHNVRGHKRTMLGLFLGALIIAGGFTLVPGRIMHKVVFGG